MKRKLFGRRGTITVFLCIILAALILVESIYIEGAFQRKREVQLSEGVSHQVEQIMSSFDRKALEWYGVYGLTSTGSNHNVFDSMTSNLDDVSFSAELIDAFDNDDLQTSISEYMRLRGIAFEGNGILERLGMSISKIKEVGGMSSNGMSKWLPSFKEYLGNKKKWKNILEKVAKAAKIVGLDDKLEDFFDFADSVMEAWEENSSAVLEFGDTSVTVSLFDPGSVSTLTSIFDAYMDADLPGFLDRLMMNEYAAFQFDSRIKTYQTAYGKEKERNIMGTPFEDIHSSNQNDLEYLLFGSNDIVNLYGSSTLILGTRLILNTGTYLMDESKKEMALGIAEILSIVIAVVSLGAVIIDPTLLQYAILFMMAYVRSLMDMFRLLEGKTVPIIYSKKTSDSYGMIFSTDYRDYFRIFLLFVPTETLLERMRTVILRDCGGSLYTGVRAMGTLGDSQYVVERRFELYENH